MPQLSPSVALALSVLFYFPTIGLLLCKSAKKTVVELTLPKDANIHAKEYQLYLPSKELLKAKLLEWVRTEEAKV